MKKPEGHFTKILARAIDKMRANPKLNGDDAYRLARLEIEAELEAAQGYDPKQVDKMGGPA